MSKKKCSFVKINKFSPLISDVLPYETPIKFSNSDLYKSLKHQYDKEEKELYKNKSRGKKNNTELLNVKDFFLKKYIPKQIYEIIKSNRYTIPYKYRIKNGIDNYREMSLIHPIAQCDICDFYENYKDTILYNTNKSKYSLRYPYKTSKYAHKDMPEKKIKLLKAWDDAKNSQTTDIQEDIIEDANLKTDIQELISTFFVYKKYSHLFKFYESKEYLDNEKTFLYMTKLDISRFFNSIYTHTLAWAVKNKEYSKLHLSKKETFEAKFDKLMQESNYNETNGIPIGAEISRIFAEIIMQDIDLQIENILSQDSKTFSFKIYRYVDDYFIFYNRKENFEKFLQDLKDVLKTYNLFLNETKTIHSNRPFITKQTILKEQLKDLINIFLDIYESENDSIALLGNVKSANWFLTKYRLLLAESDVTTSKISNFLLAQIQKKLIFLLNKILDKKCTKLEYMKNILGNVIDVVFYIYATSENASATYKLYKIIFFVMEIIKQTKSTIDSNSIKEKILQHVLKTLEIIEKKNDKILIEQLDVILLLKNIESKKYRLSSNRIKTLFNLKPKNNKTLSYFDIVVLLDYIENDKNYDDVKELLMDIIKRNFKMSHPLIYTENFLLLFDIIKSPYVDEKTKKHILHLIGINNDKSRLINEIKQKNWFYDWKEKFSITELLKVKEWTSPYF